MADEELTIRANFDDRYTDKMVTAADETEEFRDQLDATRDSAMAANVSFIAQMQALDGVASGYGKAFSGARELGLINDELAVKLRKVKGVLDLTTGSAKMLQSAHQMLATTNTAMLIPSLLGVAFAAGAVAFAYMATNAESDRQRALFSVLTGVSVALAAAQFTLAAAEASVWVAKAGPAAPAMVAIIAGSLAAMATYMASTKKDMRTMSKELMPEGQTSPGEVRMIEETGLVKVHRGEEIIRPAEISAPGPMRRMRGQEGGPIIILQGVWDINSETGLRAIAARLSAYMAKDEARMGMTSRTGV